MPYGLPQTYKQKKMYYMWVEFSVKLSSLFFFFANNKYKLILSTTFLNIFNMKIHRHFYHGQNCDVDKDSLPSLEESPKDLPREAYQLLESSRHVEVGGAWCVSAVNVPLCHEQHRLTTSAGGLATGEKESTLPPPCRVLNSRPSGRHLICLTLIWLHLGKHTSVDVWPGRDISRVVRLSVAEATWWCCRDFYAGWDFFSFASDIGGVNFYDMLKGNGRKKRVVASSR